MHPQSRVLSASILLLSTPACFELPNVDLEGPRVLACSLATPRSVEVPVQPTIVFELSRVLGVPVQFFYEDAPARGSQQSSAPGFAERSSDSHVFEFLSSREGLELNRAFSRITDPKVRKSVLDLVRSLADEAGYESPAD